MAVQAALRFGRIVKRPRAQPGDSACLPIVVVVKTPDPAIVIDWNVQMNLVAARAKLR